MSDTFDVVIPPGFPKYFYRSYHHNLLFAIKRCVFPTAATCQKAPIGILEPKLAITSYCKISIRVLSLFH